MYRPVAWSKALARTMAPCGPGTSGGSPLEDCEGKVAGGGGCDAPAGSWFEMGREVWLFERRLSLCGRSGGGCVEY